MDFGGARQNGWHHEILFEKRLYIALFSSLYDRKWPKTLSAHVRKRSHMSTSYVVVSFKYCVHLMNRAFVCNGASLTVPEAIILVVHSILRELIGILHWHKSFFFFFYVANPITLFSVFRLSIAQPIYKERSFTTIQKDHFFCFSFVVSLFL